MMKSLIRLKVLQKDVQKITLTPDSIILGKRITIERELIKKVDYWEGTNLLHGYLSFRGYNFHHLCTFKKKYNRLAHKIYLELNDENT